MSTERMTHAHDASCAPAPLRHATQLVEDLAQSFPVAAALTALEPLVATRGSDWAGSGAMNLTGRADGPPLRSRGAPAEALHGALLALRAFGVAQGRDLDGLDGIDGRLLTERATIAGSRRQGPWSAGGSLCLLRALDGWVAVNLPRRSDFDLIPALTQGSVACSDPDGWRPDGGCAQAIAAWVSQRSVAHVVARGQLLELPIVAVAGGSLGVSPTLRPGANGTPTWIRMGPSAPCMRPPGERPVVVCLASLWAGPLAASLLGLMGARVIVVESRSRPDGTRSGLSAFHDLLHAGHEMIALELAESSGVEELKKLIGHADLVIDGSRPRAMRRLGIDVERFVARGTTWLSITGYGRSGPSSELPAFGDDAAAAAGLVAYDERGPVPAGDAIADPLTGAHAAVAALGALGSGRAWLLDVAMREVARLATMLDPDEAPDVATDSLGVTRARRGRAGALGADTARIFAEFGIRP